MPPCTHKISLFPWLLHSQAMVHVQHSSFDRNLKDFQRAVKSLSEISKNHLVLLALLRWDERNSVLWWNLLSFNPFFMGFSLIRKLNRADESSGATPRSPQEGEKYKNIPIALGWLFILGGDVSPQVLLPRSDTLNFLWGQWDES